MRILESLKLHLIGELLYLANSYPPIMQKREFYRMKDRILREYGQPAGFDIQHIIKECWACYGTGEDGELILNFGQAWRKAPCRRCQGTKIYQQFWTHLLRFKIGQRVFHFPETRYDNPPMLMLLNLQRPMIEGYIVHKVPKYYLNHEAFFWLAFFFDRDLFLRSFGHWGMPSKKFTPMVILADMTWKILCIPNAIHRTRLKIFTGLLEIKQRFCRHEFKEDDMYEECPKCAISRWKTLPAEEQKEELPF